MKNQDYLSEQLLTPEETADFLKVKPKTLTNWRCLGVGPKFVKIDLGYTKNPTNRSRGLVRYRFKDLKAFIDASCVGGKR